MDELVDIYNENRIFTGKTIPRKHIRLAEGEFMLYVLAICFNNEGKMLITQRNNDKGWGAGWWEVTGGGVASGEDSLTAVAREVTEEVGLNVEGLEPRLIYTYKNTDTESGNNYFCDIYRYDLDFKPSDIVLQESEAQDFKLVEWEDIVKLHDQGIFLHYERLSQALGKDHL